MRCTHYVVPGVRIPHFPQRKRFLRWEFAHKPKKSFSLFKVPAAACRDSNNVQNPSLSAIHHEGVSKSRHALFLHDSKTKGSDLNESLPFGVNFGSLFEPQRLFHYFPIRGVGLGNRTELGIVAEGDSGCGNEDAFQFWGIETQLDVPICLRSR